MQMNYTEMAMVLVLKVASSNTEFTQACLQMHITAMHCTATESSLILCNFTICKNELQHCPTNQPTGTLNYMKVAYTCTNLWNGAALKLVLWMCIYRQKSKKGREGTVTCSAHILGEGLRKVFH